MTDDATLLRRYADEKSEEAFAAFVQRHLPLVYAAAVRRLEGDAHRAKDIAQVVFCAAARDAKKLSRHAVLTGWLYTATRNAVVDIQRAESRRRVREEEAHALHVVSVDSAAGFEWTRLRPVIDSALDELADDDREAVLLRFFQSRTFVEIGTAVGASEEAARKRVDRALDKLRDQLERRGISSTSAALAVALAGQAAAAVPGGLAASVTGAAVAAGLGAAGAGAAVFFGLTKLQAGLAAALVTAGAVGLVHQQQTIAELRDDLQRREQRVAALAAENAALTSTHAAVEAEAARLRAEGAAIRQSLADATARPAGGTPRTVRPIGGQTSATAPTASQRGSSPTGTVAVPADRRANWHKRYDPFFQARGLTAAQVDRIMELWFLQEQARLDLQASVAAKGLRGDAPGVETLRNKLYAPITAELKAILGDDGYAAYGRYEGDSYFRMIVVDSVGGRLSRANLGLSPEQVDRLAELVRVHRSSVRMNPTDIGTTTRVDWGTIADQAAGVLSAEQLRAVREFAASQPVSR